jgi:hypothetical protein
MKIKYNRWEIEGMIGNDEALLTEKNEKPQVPLFSDGSIVVPLGAFFRGVSTP